MVKRYSYLPGVALVVASAVRAALDGTWDATGLGLLAAGLLIVLGSMAWNRADVAEWLRDPRGVFAVVTGISVAVLVMVLVLLNILVSYTPWRLDLTASGRNAITTETRAILDRLEAGVRLLQFGRAPDSRVDQLLASFRRASRQVRTEFIDAERQPAAAREYGVIKGGTVIVETNGKHRKVEDPSEQGLVTAILQVTTPQERTVCFVTGHGERGVADQSAAGLSTAVALLEAANYTIERVSLLEGDVPDSCTLLVVAGPRQPLEASETDRLDAFAAAGGAVAVMTDPDPAEPLRGWLAARGISPEPGLILDGSGAGRSVGGGPETPLAFTYGDHAITRGFEIATMFHTVRPLTVADRAPAGGRPVVLAQTSDRSYAVVPPPGAKEIRVDTRRDRRGPFVLAAAHAARTSGADNPDQARLVAVGDADFMSNAMINRQGNRDFLLRIVAWLAGEQEATVVNVAPHENRRTELTERTRAWMYLVNLVLLPLIPLAAGILVFLRSRR